MSAKTSFPPRTWVEIDARSVRANINTFRKLIGPKVKLWSVVKSNAYGHGLYAFAPLAAKLGVDGFCVDSLVEGVRLRESGITKPILVLGSTLPALFAPAAAHDIVLSLSTFEDLKALRAAKQRPAFHLKLDTGMHRRGFMEKDMPRLLRALQLLASSRLPRTPLGLQGVYTHFAAPGDINYFASTEAQYVLFKKMERQIRKFAPKMMAHVAATGGTLLEKRYHRDAVRIGMGLYGYPYSLESKTRSPRPVLRSVLSWRTLISEIKTVPVGDAVGYDFTERLRRSTRLAVLPVGYWHGYPVALSSVGEVLIRGRRARVVGRVSMDLMVVDVTGIACRVGDVATLIGKDGKDAVSVWELAGRMLATHHYEILTRLNPLMERRVL